MSSGRFERERETRTYRPGAEELTEPFLSFDGDVSIEEGRGEVEREGEERRRSERRDVAELEDATVDFEGLERFEIHREKS